MDDKIDAMARVPERGSRTMLSALDLARRIEAGEIAPADVVELCAEAIDAREGEIGAFAALDVEAARRTARNSAEALRAQPLRGLPVGIKDIFETVDFPTEYGSPIYAGHRPQTDAAIVSQIRRAGGLILGKTATTEFAYLHPTKTKNPHTLRHSPGGSSSGSAAAVAAGMLPIAIGSQTGGSVIRPASYCGVVGFKPSYKLLPTVGMKCFSWHLDTVGLFAASVRDVAFATAAISGRDLRVDALVPTPPRIAFVRTHVWSEASPEMHEAVEHAVALAEQAGGQVTEIVLPPILEDGVRAHAIIQDYEAYRSLAFEYDRHGDRLSPPLRQALDAAAMISADAYDDARRVSKRARQALAELMGGIDVILTPSAPGAAPEGFTTIGRPTFNRLWTLMGNPCVNVPGLNNPEGLPLGIQIVGRFGRDRATLEAARFLESVLQA